MSKYTTEVRYICEMLSGLSDSVGYDNISTVISSSRTKIFSFPYDIHDEAYRPVLETKILKHYYTREICAETYGRWKLFLESRMAEIMPKYAKLYKTASMIVDPLREVDYYKQHSGHGNGNTIDRGSNTGTISTDTNNHTTEREPDLKTVVKNLDTPQGGLTGIENNNYLSSANITEQSGKETVKTNGNIEQTNNLRNDNTRTYSNTDDYLDHVYGKVSSVSYAALLKEYRDTLINIDQMVIDELSDLFINLW